MIFERVGDTLFSGLQLSLKSHIYRSVPVSSGAKNKLTMHFIPEFQTDNDNLHNEWIAVYNVIYSVPHRFKIVFERSATKSLWKFP